MSCRDLFVRRILTEKTPVLNGPSLHLGRVSRVQMRPADLGHGIRFRNPTWPQNRFLKATMDNVQPRPRCTNLQQGSISVRTVEHLMAALGALGIYDVEVLIEGAEVPLLDGSALPFARSLLECSIEQKVSPRCLSFEVTREIDQREGQSRCWLSPFRTLRIECSIDFDHPMIGQQRVCYRQGSAEHFLEQFARARTFGFVREYAELKRAGLARGASLAGVLVYSEDGILNPEGRRYIDEPVRHKTLDAIGDLALLGGPFFGKVRLFRCSHRLLQRTIKKGLDSGVIRATT